VRVAFVHNYPTRFVEIDRRLISAEHDVQDCCVRSTFTGMLDLVVAVRSSDAVFARFASWHSHHGIEGVPATHLSDRENLVITVGNVSWSILTRKGLKVFCPAAALLPEYRVVLVGRLVDAAIDHLRSISAPNVFFSGFVDEATLRDYYEKASVYVQASAHEGFGMSLAEAMLAGCVPVTTPCAAIPEVAGDEAVYVDSTGPEHIAAAIREAAVRPLQARERAQQRVLKLFSLERRRASLNQCLEASWLSGRQGGSHAT
jgi:glycosyltransferase involved in cell wall biosynthesis